MEKNGEVRQNQTPCCKCSAVGKHFINNKVYCDDHFNENFTKQASDDAVLKEAPEDSVQLHNGDK